MQTIKIKNRRIFEINFLTNNKKINNKDILNIIKDTIKKCYKQIPIRNKKITIYDSNDSFIKNKMKGVSGNTFDKNKINIHINPVRGWEKELSNTIAHEYSHLAILDIKKWETLLDSLIIEGIAENFREEVIGGKSAPWTLALSKKESKILLKKIKAKLRSKRHQLYIDLFFGSKIFKEWSGYSLGYHIVNQFKKINPDLKWNAIIKLSHSEILKMSKFT